MSKAEDPAVFGEPPRFPPTSAHAAAHRAFDRRAVRLAVLFVAVITVWRLYALGISDIDLFFDEAQYWYWAKEPAFGYFSKPPLLAWLIGVSTWAFGDTEFAVRAISPVCYALTALFGGLTAARLYGQQAGAWTAVILASLPGVSVSATIASTDVPLLLCWAAALYCWVRFAEDDGHWWIGLGAAIGAGMMAKYAMIYFLLGAVLAFLVTPRLRPMLRRPGLYGALLLAGLLFLPNVWWNWANDFVSFGHTAENAHWQGVQFKFNKLGEFIGGQFGVFGPILLIALGFAVYGWRRLEPKDRMLAAFSLPVLLLMTVQSLVSRANANWAAVAYVAAAILVTGWLLRQDKALWLKISLWLQVLVCAAVLHGAAYAPLTGTDPWHRQRGWTGVAEGVRQALDAHPGAVLVTTDRKAAASLMYYVRPHPWDMVKWNPDGHIDDHYELTSNHAGLTGKDAVLVTRGGNADSLRESFASVEPLGSVERLRPTRPPEVFNLFLLTGYRGE